MFRYSNYYLIVAITAQLSVTLIAFKSYVERHIGIYLLDNNITFLSPFYVGAIYKYRLGNYKCFQIYFSTKTNMIGVSEIVNQMALVSGHIHQFQIISKQTSTSIANLLKLKSKLYSIQDVLDKWEILQRSLHTMNNPTARNYWKCKSPIYQNGEPSYELLHISMSLIQQKL